MARPRRSTVLLKLYVRIRSEVGQTTAEYALVLVGVAAIALLLVAWAGDTNKIGRLLDGVLDSILDKIP